MPPSKEMIGRVLSTGSATVTAEHVAAFAQALGDANPEYATLAPPTYPIAFMTQAMSGGMETFLELGLNFMTLVHGEQEFEFGEVVKSGDVITTESEIVEIYEKKGKSFITMASTSKNQRGEMTVKGRWTFIVRG